jgi:hypothetical protein
MLRQQGYREPDPLPDRLRSAMLVETNERIDRATSARALSLSWAMRVAVPGVVAIIAFFIGLHYYGTPVRQETDALAPVLVDFSDGALDSLMEAHAMVDTTTLVEGARGGLFDISGELAADYLLATNQTGVVVEMLQDREVDDVLTVLAGNRHTTF